MKKSKLLALGLFVSLLIACNPDTPAPEQLPQVIHVSDQDFIDEETSSFSVAEGFDCDLWAPGPLLANAVAVSFDSDGTAYVSETRRRKSSDIDIREHRDWVMEDLGLTSVAETEAFHLHKLDPAKSSENEWLEDFNGDGSHDYRDLSVQSEIIRRVWDEDGDGRADAAQIFADGINEMLTGVAAGVLRHDGATYVTAAPHVYRFKDSDGDKVADTKEILSTGYGIHIAYAGHDMSGLTIGTDGRLYWSIGDMGVNVKGDDGTQWRYPHEGAVMRCELDGSNFEVFAHGLRNPQELAFDQYGNLFSVDNDGDHPGEHERYVHILQGSDTGWRIYWQFGKYNQPYDDYKIWIDEQLHVPHFTGQAAYLLPPLALAPDGPAGLAYNPGTALGEQWKNHFFASYFKGSAARSKTEAFRLEPRGATFTVAEETNIITGIASTGVNFGPDGALYINDWKDGYALKPQGRIWKLDVVGPHKNPLREETEMLLPEDFKALSDELLFERLSHPDQRVRLKSQFSLAEKGAFDALLQYAKSGNDEIGALHAIWGLGQILRKEPSRASDTFDLLKDGRDQVRAQTARIIGDCRASAAGPQLLPLLSDKNSFVCYFAAEALGKIKYAPSFDALISKLEEIKDADPHLRHGLVYALSQLATDKQIRDLYKGYSADVRVAAVVALRHQKSPLVADFLQDENDLVLVEAARAIHDDESIPEALPALAASLNNTKTSSEAFLRRAINANLRLGGAESGSRLITFAENKRAAEELRIDAIWALGHWSKLPILDRVEGRHRPLPARSAGEIKSEMTTFVKDILATTSASSPLQTVATEVIGRLELPLADPLVHTISSTKASADLRGKALVSLANLNDSRFTQALEVALKSDQSLLRQKGLQLLESSSLDARTKINLLATVLEVGALSEQQEAVAALAQIDHDEAHAVLEGLTAQYLDGSMNPGLMLDLATALEQGPNTDLASKISEYESTILDDNTLKKYRMCLSGGDRERGQQLFAFSEAAQCLRCHQVKGYGGEVGPDLTKIGSLLDREELLLSMVDPSDRIAPGYGTVSLKIKSGEEVSGILIKETDEALYLAKTPQEEPVAYPISEIEERTEYPSGMLNMAVLLEKSEIRDLVEFLVNLK